MKRMFLRTVAVSSLLLSIQGVYAQGDLQKQVEEVKGALPKFAIPMREVGDRFQNIYFAVDGGNWALAAYMSKYMDKALNPAKVTKHEEYQIWRDFYDKTFASVNKAIQAKDKKAFESAYMAVIKECNGCHEGMGYGFIKVVKMHRPANVGVEYEMNTEPTAVPK